MGKDLAVPGAVHGLQAELLLLDIESEHVLGVVAPVSRRLPQVRLVHVGRHDLLEPSQAVLLLHQSHERAVDAGSMGKPEGRTRRHLVEKEEFLVLADFAVVPLSSLGEEGLVLFQSLLVGE